MINIRVLIFLAIGVCLLFQFTQDTLTCFGMKFVDVTQFFKIFLFGYTGAYFLLVGVLLFYKVKELESPLWWMIVLNVMWSFCIVDTVAPQERVYECSPKGFIEMIQAKPAVCLSIAVYIFSLWAIPCALCCSVLTHKEKEDEILILV